MEKHNSESAVCSLSRLKKTVNKMLNTSSQTVQHKHIVHHKPIRPHLEKKCETPFLPSSKLTKF